jgi:hypothetical protein
MLNVKIGSLIHNQLNNAICIMLVSFIKNKAVATSGAGTVTLPVGPSSPGFCGVRITEYIAFCVVFRRSSLVFLFCWPLYCMSFLRNTTSDYPYGIFKFSMNCMNTYQSLSLFEICG